MKKAESIYNICEKVNSEIELDFGGGCPIEKSFLMSYLIQNQCLKTHVEIGIYKGKSLFPVAYSIFLNGGKSYGIDPYSVEDAEEINAPNDLQDRINDFLPKVNFEKLYQDVIMYREKCGYGDNLKIIREPSQEAIKYFKENNITIDFLHIDGNHDTKFVRQDFELYNSILSEGGFIVFDDINWESVNIVYKEAKKKLTVVFECEHYGILYKEKDGFKDFIKTEKLSKRLTSIHDKIKNRFIKPYNKPLITVGVLTYNQEDYIEECLRNIIEQKGNFRCKVIILDDKSTDNTQSRIEGFLSNITVPENFEFEYIRNELNLGIVKNYSKLVNLIKDSGCDFFTFCEGDDFYFTNNRLEAHLALHLNNPELALSFNKLLLYFQEENRYEVHVPNFNAEKLTTEELVKDNTPGSLCASFYCSDVFKHLQNDLFEDMFTGDWLFAIYCSQFGDIGHINIPMSLYRKHSKGVWSGHSGISNNLVLLEEIPKYNKYLNFLYDREFYTMYNLCTKYLLNNNDIEPYDLVIIDNIFPHPYSGFSYQEFTGLLKNFKNSAVYAIGTHTHYLSKDPIENLITNYKRKYPELSDRVWNLDNNSSFKANLIYGIFLNTAYYDLLHWSEKLQTPFVFTLYPGGGFLLNDEKSDKMLKAIFASPWFRKVIVTQKITYDYLVNNKFCKTKDIEYIFGVVTDNNKINKQISNKRHFGINKNTLDICFVAHKYTEKGIDKGYDLFIESAKQLSKKYDNICFHIVGPWTKDIIDTSGIKNIVFYGSQNPSWFTEFYKDKDIIISANTNNVSAKGAFDGFPTTSVTDAALCEVAMFCTDPLNFNNGEFKDKNEIIILKHSAKDIVKKIEYYYNNPNELFELSKNGKLKSEYIYSYDNQMIPRVNLLEKIIKNSIENIEIKNSTPNYRCRIKSKISKVTPNLIKMIYRKLKRITNKVKQI